MTGTKINRTYGSTASREPLVFGSKAFNEYHHGKNTGRPAPDRQKRARAARVKAERQEAAQTKKAKQAWASLDEKQAKADAATLGRILPGGRAFAVKVSPHDSRAITAADVDSWRAAGWSVWGTGTAPAKVGAGLAADRPVKANPDWLHEYEEQGAGLLPEVIPYRPELLAVLGPAMQARAVLVGRREGVTAADVERMQRAGFDVGAAPKGFREAFQEEVKSPANGRHRPPTGATRSAEARHAGPMAKRTTTNPGRESAPKTRTAAGLSGLEKAWEKWTGSKAGARLMLDLPDLGEVPAAVVLLGRVSMLAGPKEAKDFGTAGPFLVTDEHMERAWLVDPRARRFQISMVKGGLIVYTAKKAKFGDVEPVRYVHAFTGRVSAWMEGHTGELVGGFRITPRGLEG